MTAKTDYIESPVAIAQFLDPVRSLPSFEFDHVGTNICAHQYYANSLFLCAHRQLPRMLNSPQIRFTPKFEKIKYDKTINCCRQPRIGLDELANPLKAPNLKFMIKISFSEKSLLTKKLG